MNSFSSWIMLLALGLVANVPFVWPRLLFLGPSRAKRSLAWRLIEVLLGVGLVVGLGMLWEARIGQHHPQGWEFYAVMVCLGLTLGFPGFVWRYLRRGHSA